MDEAIKQILDMYSEFHENTKKGLRESGMSQTDTELYTVRLPDLNKLLPDDAIRFFNGVKKQFIFYLDSRGFSQREIARRLGGSSQNAVFEILKESKNETAS